MKVPFVDLSRPYQQTKQNILKKIEELMERSDFILGDEVKKFEEEFAAYIGVKHGIGVASGTDALHLALRACDVGPDDEVITAANTFIATATAITLTGARTVLVDVDPKTYNINPALIEAKITKKTKVIIPVHLYGQPAAMGEIMRIARKHSLKVIEDAAQAHGAFVATGKKAGSDGDLACFSFYPAKNLGAAGDAGMVVTDNAQLAEKVRLLRNYGQKVKNQHTLKGFNSRLDNLQAAVLRIKLKYLDQWNQQRQANARIYQEFFTAEPRLKSDEVILANPSNPTGKTAGPNHVYHLYVILAQNRDKLADWLKERKIATGLHYPVPIHLHECYQDLGYQSGDFPVAEEYAAKTLSLPMYPDLTKEQIKWVVDSVKEFCK